ncbi:unnamed protein product [Aphanomyces euteiches]
MYTSLGTISSAAVRYGTTFASLDEAKHNILVVCIALLHALNEIQERWHLSSLDVLVQAEQHLRDLLRAECFSSSKSASLPDDATLVSILYAVWQWLHELAMSACRQIHEHVMHVPGVSRLVVWLQAHFSTTNNVPSASEVDTMTAIVLSYTEKDIPLSSALNHRIQRSMHYPINLKPFDATVQLQPAAAMVTAGCLPPTSLKSPQSMPTSPTARVHWQSSLASLSQNVLYNVRDQLRAELAATVGGTDICIVKFNRHDCHTELQLSCGAHAATKVLPGLYRTVRASSPIPLDRAIYFEMSVDHHATSCCIGLSPQALPCNALVGTQKHTIGVYSKSGMILAHSVQIPVPGLACSVTTTPSNYGLLVHRSISTTIPEAHCIQVLFSRFAGGEMAVSELCEVLVPATLELFPTVTLDSMHHTILSRFAPSDLIVPWELWTQCIAWQYPAIYTLDGTLWSARAEDTT